ncbi:MAG: hypothetical protein OXU20_01515, partial [Myxococcales bacterium]|nr:hypothetical protein [Myxococcales bacterium]
MRSREGFLVALVSLLAIEWGIAGTRAQPLPAGTQTERHKTQSTPDSQNTNAPAAKKTAAKKTAAKKTAAKKTAA